MKPVRVIGIGSPFGDDRVGWLAVEALRRGSPKEVTLLTLDRPGVNLVRALQGAGRVLLVDAVRSGAAPGTLHRLAGQDLTGAEPVVSSHDFGVAAAVRLADALGVLPPHLVLFGIEIGDPGASEAVRKALPELVRAIRMELGLIDGPSPEPPPGFGHPDAR